MAIPCRAKIVRGWHAGNDLMSTRSEVDLLSYAFHQVVLPTCCVGLPWYAVVEAVYTELRVVLLGRCSNAAFTVRALHVPEDTSRRHSISSR